VLKAFEKLTAECFFGGAMKIRAITIGAELQATLDRRVIAESARVATQLAHAYEAEGIAVQTIRFASQPFPRYLGSCSEKQLLQFAVDLQQCCRDHDIDYCSLGPVDPQNPRDAALVPYLPRLIAGTDSVFASAILTESARSLSLKTAQAIARVMHQIAQMTNSGFGNLRFAGLVNCPPHIPFFPAAFHNGAPAFALALEAADVIAAACEPGLDFAELRSRLRQTIETRVLPVQEIATRFASPQFRYLGIDLSPAPGPAPEVSIAYALERLGRGRFGEPGTLAAAAAVTAALRETSFLTCGYCGLMLPVLEDAGLAERNNQGLLRLSSLLAYSAVCGTGLDTIPLPGDVTEEQLTAILIDVASLGTKLNKPLSARLFPIPGKRAGEQTDFSFSYFVNTQVMPIL
jgi:uncharacterized protein